MESKNLMVNISIIIALLVAVVIGVLVYFSIADAGELGTTIELVSCTNTTNLTHTLSYAPDSGATEFDAHWFNTTSSDWSSIAANLTQNGRSITFVTTGGEGHSGQIYSGLTQANFTYNTTAAVLARDNVNPQVQTVFTLAPIIAIVIIASVLLIVITGFGSKPGL